MSDPNPAPAEEPTPDPAPEARTEEAAEAVSAPVPASAPQAQVPVSAPAGDPPPAEPLSPDRPVTGAVMRAAATSPSEVREILREEALRGRKQASGRSPVTPAATARPQAPAGRPAPRPAAARPAPAPAPPPAAAPASAPAAPATAAAAPATAPAATAAAAPAPSAAPVASPAAPAAPSSPPPGGAARPRATPGRGGMQIVLPAPRLLPVIVVLAAQAVLVVCGLLWLGRTLRPLAASSAPPPPAPAPAASPASEPARPERPGGLVELGQGRALLLAPDGRLIVLQADPFSGELRLERVYALAHDLDRHLGTPLRRAHGYYLEDVEREAQARVEAERARFAQVVADAADGRTADIDDAERAAVRLIEAGGAGELLPMLTPAAAGAVYAVRQHAAAFALGRAGYPVAVEALIELLGEHAGSRRLAPRLKKILSHLTGLELEPLPSADVISACQAWVQTHPPADRPARLTPVEGAGPE